MEDHSGQIRIERPVYEHEQLRQDFNYEQTRERKIGCKAKCSLKKNLGKTVPVVKWLPAYNWREDLLSDFISGFTVAVMHIPQGMAYALLGNVPPIVGIYMAFFPVLVYFFLGTSKHNSMGTFAVVCLMTGQAVLKYSDPIYFSTKASLNSSDTKNTYLEANNDTKDLVLDTSSYTPLEVATTVTFIAAIFQIAMYILRLGAVSALLSETLVSGFTTGAAIQVLTSQIKDLIGLKIPKHKGYFALVHTYISIFENIGNVNWAAIIISAITITATALNNELLKPIVAKVSVVPVPIELIVVIIGTLVSKYCYLESSYGVKVIGNIPQGLPVPEAPNLELIPKVALDGFTTAIVAYTITLSMALIFAQKFNYEVDANQELLAMGAGNLFSSFFSCMPVSASLSRSLIQSAAGGKTQIASIFSCMILLVVLLWIGPFFEPLPKAVLASVIVVALKGMLLQVKDFMKFLKLSKMDALVWMLTLLSVVFIGIDVGLLVGVIFSLITIFILGFMPYTCLLGSIPHTDLYLDINKYKSAEQIPGLKIFQYCGGINFATKGIFKTNFIKLIGMNPQKEIILREKLLKLEQKDELKDNSKVGKIEKLKHKINNELKCVILDFSTLSYIDPSGVSLLKSIAEDFKKLNIPLLVAAASENVYETMLKCDLISTRNLIRCYPTVYDAVHSCQELVNSNLNLSVISL